MLVSSPDAGVFGVVTILFEDFALFDDGVIGKDLPERVPAGSCKLLLRMLKLSSSTTFEEASLRFSMVLPCTFGPGNPSIGADFVSSFFVISTSSEVRAFVVALAREAGNVCSVSVRAP